MGKVLQGKGATQNEFDMKEFDVRKSSSKKRHHEKSKTRNRLKMKVQMKKMQYTKFQHEKSFTGEEMPKKVQHENSPQNVTFSCCNENNATRKTSLRKKLRIIKTLQYEQK